MAQTLARMARDGLIRAGDPDPRDGRSSLVSLTKKALCQDAGAARGAARRSGRTGRGLDDAEVATLAVATTLLKRLNRNLDRGD